MGSTRLKKKDQWNYRKGFPDDSLNCKKCVNYLPNCNIHGIGGVFLRIEDRCSLMGTESSIKYRIKSNFTCDKQTLRKF